jgi:hypothetical protein
MVNGDVSMQTDIYLQETLLKLFVVINLRLSKPLRMTLSELTVYLLENNEAQISKVLFPERKILRDGKHKKGMLDIRRVL